ncbi:MAG: DUF4190 domain-containing protein [Clostridia bacterium]|nr:DUF4190 domain-containing protein [Clostridia bacterium]
MSGYDKQQNDSFSSDGFYEYKEENSDGLSGVIEELSTPKTKGYAIASLILGIFSVVCCCVGWMGLIAGAGAIVLSVLSRRHLGYFDTMTIVGLILGIFGVVFGVLTLVFEALLATEEFMIEFEKRIDDLYGDFDVNTYT